MKSNKQYVIAEQPDSVLTSIMRGILAMNPMDNSNEDIIALQIQSLNQLVLDYAVAETYTAALAYKKYRHEISHLKEPFQYPTYVAASTERKQPLELKPFL